jgi:hypothetical protein
MHRRKKRPADPSGSIQFYGKRREIISFSAVQFTCECCISETAFPDISAYDIALDAIAAVIVPQFETLRP